MARIRAYTSRRVRTSVPADGVVRVDMQGHRSVTLIVDVTAPLRDILITGGNETDPDLHDLFLVLVQGATAYPVTLPTWWLYPAGEAPELPAVPLAITTVAVTSTPEFVLADVLNENYARPAATNLEDLLTNLARKGGWAFTLEGGKLHERVTHTDMAWLPQAPALAAPVRPSDAGAVTLAGEYGVLDGLPAPTREQDFTLFLDMVPGGTDRTYRAVYSAAAEGADNPVMWVRLTTWNTLDVTWRNDQSGIQVSMSTKSALPFQGRRFVTIRYTAPTSATGTGTLEFWLNGLKDANIGTVKVAGRQAPFTRQTIGAVRRPGRTTPNDSPFGGVLSAAAFLPAALGDQQLEELHSLALS